MDYDRGGTQRASYAPDEVREVPCPFCGAEAPTPLFREYGSVEVVRCDCGQIYTSPRILDPEGVYHGDRDAYHREARLVFEGRAPHHRDPNYREELDLIGRHRAPPGRFLDVGCNMGMLLRLARDRGWETTGVDPSPSLSGLAREELGLDVLTCFLHEVPPEHDGRYDVVALSDVFEHVSDPLGMLADVDRLLAPDGILYVKVPNARFNLFKQAAAGVLGRTPQHGVWDSYEHVVHYTDETLRRMLARGGFRVVELATPRPVQIPVWHHLVGQYYQHPSPWTLDWRRHLGRSLFHALGQGGAGAPPGLGGVPVVVAGGGGGARRDGGRGLTRTRGTAPQIPYCSLWYSQ